MALDRSPPSTSVELSTKSEVTDRLAAIAPVLADQLDGRASSGSAGAVRNLAVHDFSQTISANKSMRRPSSVVAKRPTAAQPLTAA